MTSPISDIIDNKAVDLFDREKEPAENKSENEEKKEAFDLQSDSKSELENSAKDSELEVTKSTDQLKSMIHTMRDQLDAMLRIINGEQIKIKKITNPTAEILETGEQIIEGVFNGEKMIGPDGQGYDVPPNYASKSKLVEGDIMKLTITKNGRFVYKQISPIERKRLVGELITDNANDQWSVLAEGKTYKVLKASVTFYKGKPGDEVVFFIPENGESSWGAVENIIRHDT